ncbi:MAG: aryl-sulfate sulfotransferase [Saprospiraceae bacterium]|nr:aryl-sulfate sulfotransferase [Saprospiraceae bacterium]
MGVSQHAQQTVGLITNQSTIGTEGYTFIYPINQANGYLINNCGELIHQWPDDQKYMAGAAAYITPEGHLLKTKRDRNALQDKIFAPGAGGTVELRDWDNQVIWSFTLNNEQYRLHHDIKLMPNGHVLMLVWEYKSKADCITAGRDSSYISDGKIYAERIIEFDPVSQSIVWEWNVWDHLIQDFDSTKSNYGDVGAHPEKIDINLNTAGSPGLPNADWMHINSMDYNPFTDQILISVPTFNELMIIDHSTTASQAKGPTGGLAGKGGDVIYRWGNPVNYRQGGLENQKLFFQHDTKWLIYDIPQNHPDFGKISIFNNRYTATTSIGVFIVPPWDMYQWSYTKTGTSYGPADYARVITHPEPFKQNSPITSVVQILPYNHLFMTAGNKGYCYELDSDNEVVWEYILPFKANGPVPQGTILLPNDNPIFSARRFPVNFPGFAGKDLGPKGFIELEPDSTYCARLVSNEEQESRQEKIYPNPVNNTLFIESASDELYQLFMVSGTLVKSGKLIPGENSIDVAELADGMYLFIAGERTQVLCILH